MVLPGFSNSSILKTDRRRAKTELTDLGSGEYKRVEKQSDKFDKEVVGDDPCCSPNRDLSMTLRNWAQLATGGQRIVASIAANWRRPRETRQ